MRVLITGMGGQLGTLVARRLEFVDGVEAVVGIDLDPPRRHLRQAEFHWIRPGDATEVAELVDAFDPTVVFHLGLYEPHARLVPRAADEATRKGTEGLLAGLARARSLEAIVMRSGIEVYGRRRGGPICPDETALPDPTSTFGSGLLLAEEAVTEFAGEVGIPATLLRFAPIAGFHTPNPLIRLLKLQAVPVPVLSEPTFSLVHAGDAADVIVAAARSGVDGPVNVVADGAVSAYQAVRIGGRVPLPMLGPTWAFARAGVGFVGAPLPDQVRELLVRGRSADGGRCTELIGVGPVRSTRDIIDEIYEEHTVEFYEPSADAAA